MNFFNEDLRGESEPVIHSLREHSQLCDIQISVSDPSSLSEKFSFKAHKVILCGSSPYFRAMFTGSMEESTKDEVTIHGITNKAMKVLLDYCYTGKIEINSQNAQEILSAAGILQLHWVVNKCSEFMIHQLEPSNCLGIRTFGDTHSCQSLLKSASVYAVQHFMEVIENQEFLELSSENLSTLLSSNDLNVKSEELVYNALMKWLKFDLNERKCHLAVLLAHVRLPLLERNFLVSVVGGEPLIKTDEQCRDLLDEAKNWLLLPEQRSKYSSARTQPRVPLQSDELVFAVGGWCSGDAISLVEKYSVHSNEWKVAATMAKRRCGVGVAVLGDLLYAIGGHDGSNYLNTMERYDLKTDQWSSNLPPTASCRTSIGVGILDDCIYAVGGQDGISCLNAVEKYCPSSNTWTSVTPMAKRRLGVGVAVCGRYLYAVGGSDGNSPLESVERYDPDSNTWTEVAPMATQRKHLGVAVLDDIIYAVGGRDETTELNSVEKYDHLSNSWTSVVAMNYRRSGVGLCAVSSKLFAIGGFDGNTYLKSVEFLDTSANQWTLGCNMNYRRLGCGVGVIRNTS